MLEVAKVLRRRIGPAAKKVPRIQLPDWIIRLAAKRNPMLQEMVPQLGKIRNSSNAKAKQLLGWAPRSSEEVITSTAKSLLKFGIVGRDAISNQGH